MDKKAINIFEEIHKLNFPSDQYIVVGSGIMAVKGIREACDLDIVVSQELFEKCKSEDWEVMPWTRSGKLGKEWLKKGITDLMLEVMSGDKTFDLKTLVKEGEKVQGVWFMSLSQLIFFKKEYGRQKDFDDITLMEKYIKENSK
ncbi:MAG: hypothetical protein RJA61_229 [Candidatus Parcubacteria bacterium]|jgi:hypothetical protein